MSIDDDDPQRTEVTTENHQSTDLRLSQPSTVNGQILDSDVTMLVLKK